VSVSDSVYYGSAIGYLHRHHLPLTFEMPPWELLLPRVSAVFARTDAGGNPLSISPFGPIAPWYQAGREWARHPSLREIEQLYPDPPLVLFISDNEAHHVNPDELNAPYSVHASAQVIARRRAIGDAWIVRYKAMIRGFRDGLDTPGWRARVLFMGYDAFVTPATGGPTPSTFPAGRSPGPTPGMAPASPTTFTTGRRIPTTPFGAPRSRR
jgi:hypothetical protein